MRIYTGVSGIWFADCDRHGIIAWTYTRADAAALADQHARDCGHIGGGR